MDIDRLIRRDEQEELERCRAEINTYQWKSVDNELPKYDGEYLVIVQHEFSFPGLGYSHTMKGRFVALYNAQYKDWMVMHDVVTRDVTHWMPLPPMPESESDAE